MRAYMVEMTIDDRSVQYKAVVAKDEAHARHYARQSGPAALAVQVRKSLSASEIRGLGLEGKPEGHVEPWTPQTP